MCQGETGCGKTTQLPQFILEDAIASGLGPATNIVCTQPRRISAISVAKRVAQERGEAVGQTIGYRTRVQQQTSPCTKLLFCTSGALTPAGAAAHAYDFVTNIPAQQEPEHSTVPCPYPAALVLQWDDREYLAIAGAVS